MTRITRPQLAEAEWRAVWRTFDELVDLSPDDREAKLRSVALTAPIIARVRELLRGYECGGILDDDPAAARNRQEEPLPNPPIIAGYIIQRLIGRGGTSDVYLAERVGDGFEQRVALKILVANVIDFREEARLLAKLDHPGIAPLVDAGIMADGRRYIAMAFVDGDEITDWCARVRADLSMRLDVFLQVCEAVRYAHARLVIHRDIKPANIRIDAAGRARLLDFGIARLLDAGTLDYRASTRNLATPVYAAPEQLAGGELSVAADVYALGALLFELLAATPPWPHGQSLLPTIVHRLARPEPGLPSAASCNPYVASTLVAGDLDAIVGKAMRTEAADRYLSVEALAADVRRFVTHRPVQARSGARAYRLRRFARRQRWPIAAAAVLLLAIAGGTIGTIGQSRLATRQRDAALAEAARLDAVNQAMILIFAGERAGGGPSMETRARALAETLPPTGDSAAVIAAIADLLLMMERPETAKALLEKALRRRMGDAASPDFARLQLKLAAVFARERRFDDAQALLTLADVVWRRDPERYQRERVEAVGARAYIARLQGRLADAIALLRGNMTEAEVAYAGYGRELASRYTNLTTRLREAGRVDEAAEVVRHGERVLGRDALRNAEPLLTLRRTEALVEEQRGNPVRAEAILRKLVADRRVSFGTSPALAADLLHQARLVGRSGKPAEAAALLRQAQPIFASFLGPDTDATLMAELMTAEQEAALGQVIQVRGSPLRTKAIAASPLLSGLRSLAAAQMLDARGDRTAATQNYHAAAAAFAAGGLSGAAYRPIVDVRWRHWRGRPQG